MTVLDLITSDGYGQYKRVASTRNGEWAGPCPSCGGRDRFRIHPFHNQDKGGSYWCRQCGIGGDAIQYLIDFRNKTYSEACHIIGVEPSNKKESGFKSVWMPKESPLPNEQWIHKASTILMNSVDCLWLNSTKHVDYLLSRGLREPVIRKFLLGYIPATQYFPPEDWGIEPWQNEKGNRGRIVVHQGIIIPLLDADGRGVLRLRIRKDDGSNPPYVLVKGSSTIPFFIDAASNCDMVVVVESELDALLLHQNAGDLISIIALGSVTCRPDIKTDAVLKKFSTILVALDTDSAGMKQAWMWWQEHYPSATRFPIPKKYGKDPTEAYRNGLNLREWVEIGIEDVGKPLIDANCDVVTDKLPPSEEKNKNTHENAPSVLDFKGQGDPPKNTQALIAELKNHKPEAVDMLRFTGHHGAEVTAVEQCPAEQTTLAEYVQIVEVWDKPQDRGKPAVVKQPEWSDRAKELIDWFRNAHLPMEPFQLSRHETITDPMKYYAMLGNDIEAGPTGARARCGVLEDDLKKLRDYCEKK
jgi:hypothetical protein